jgi:CheY-like chemotaxis protein
MTRILLVDDSPHAQRMGERILSDEGYEVVTVSNADSALIRLDDVDPDIVIADTVMPGRTGYDICQYLKMSPRHRHVRVILTAGVLESLDEEHSKRVEADGSLMKPFEATALLAMVKPLAEAAAADRAAQKADSPRPAGAPAPKSPAAPFIAVVDEEQVRAAVTVALDAAMAGMIEDIARRVVAALASKKPEAVAAAQPRPPMAEFAPVPPPPATPVLAPPMPTQPKPAPPEPASPGISTPGTSTVRRVTPVRLRSSSILGLDVGPPDPES